LASKIDSLCGKGPFVVCNLDASISLSSLREEFCGAPFSWGPSSRQQAPLLIDEMVESIVHREISSFLCGYIQNLLRGAVPELDPGDPHIEIPPRGRKCRSR
jgi:hypothetical protein